MIHQYGYLGLFFVFLTEMLGAPFPAETTLTLAGLEWGRGVLSFTPLWIAAVCGNVVGASIAYGIGYYLGYPVVLRYGRFVGLTAKRFEVAEGKFEKYGQVVVFFGKFVSGIRVLTPFIAGINRMNLARFSLINAMSAMLWAAVFIFEGRYIATLWARYHETLAHHLGFVGLFLAVLMVAAFLLVKRRLKQRMVKKANLRINRNG